LSSERGLSTTGSEGVPIPRSSEVRGKHRRIIVRGLSRVARGVLGEACARAYASVHPKAGTRERSSSFLPFELGHPLALFLIVKLVRLLLVGAFI
jgi:hypothetical protein